MDVANLEKGSQNKAETGIPKKHPYPIAPLKARVKLARLIYAGNGPCFGLCFHQVKNTASYQHSSTLHKL